MPIVREYQTTYQKRPIAVETVTVDFKYRLPVGQSILGHEIMIYDSFGADKTSPMLVASAREGTRISATLRSGTDLQDYFVVYSLLCDTERPEETVKLMVRS